MLRIMISVVFVIEGCHCFEQTLGSGGRVPRSGRIDFMESLRRRLMVNNYDYDYETEDEDKPPPHGQNHSVTNFQSNEKSENLKSKQNLEGKEKVRAPPRKGNRSQSSHTTHSIMRGLLGPNYLSDRSDHDSNASETSETSYSNSRQDADGAGVKMHNLNELLSPDVGSITDKLDAPDAQQTDDKLSSPASNLHTLLNRLEFYQKSPIPGPDFEHSPFKQPIDKLDLLYYMDNDRLRRNNFVSADSNPVELGENGTEYSSSASLSGEVHPSSPSPVDTLSGTTDAGVTYDILQVRGGGGRRSVLRKVLEERGPDGVVLEPLDRDLLPFMRLPSARRQYMQEHTDVRQPSADELDQYLQSLVP